MNQVQSSSSEDFDAVVVGALAGFPIHLGVKTHGGFLNRVEFLSPDIPELDPFPDSFAAEVKRQLLAYFSDPSFTFDLPVEYASTSHQQSVWDKLKTIPLGETLTYSQFAHEIGSGARAVGNACRRNPIPVVVPCHRVVSVGGIGGFAGASQGGLIDLKTQLLKHEGVIL